MHTIAQLRSGELTGIRRLNVSCGLTTFPSEIFQLADSLEILDLSGNALAELPDDLARLTNLRAIFCAENDFTHLPKSLGGCPRLSVVGFKANRIRTVSREALPRKLRWLTLTDNVIEELPPEIGDCVELQKLLLAGNRLRTLPAGLANCKRLELIRIAANRLDTVPAWLSALPRLSWLAYGGNPITATMETQALTSAGIAEISWGDLEIEGLLGQGASGVIHRARLRRDDGAETVAVKLFKGAMTSDGLPGSEIAAAVCAGLHPNLVGVIGQVNDHPSGNAGLVLPLIDGTFGNLAAPPSLETCTRDLYDPSATFGIAEVQQIARGIASAARHLHSLGLLHGDLYAHNILWSRDNQTLIGDFGASSFYDVNDASVERTLQSIEVRAFGCLLEELIERCDAPEDDVALRALIDLRSHCLSEDHAARPSFDAIILALDPIDAASLL